MAVNAARKPGRPRESAIDVDLIVETAWALVDREGLAGLSTRTLAAALNVKSPALYWHVRSKEALLSLMVEHLLQHSLEGLSPSLPWRDWLGEVGRRQRNLLLAHRDSGLIASLASPTERMQAELFVKIMAPLLGAGLPSKVASAAAGGVAGLVLGWVIYEQRPETRAFVEAFHPSDEGFELALQSLIEGVGTRADRPAAQV